MPINQEQCDILKRHEGYRAKVYKCPAGKDTIGYGLNIEANPLKLSDSEIKRLRTSGTNQVEAEYYLKLVCNQIEAQLQRRLTWFADLDSNTKFVMINMSYNLGVEGLLEFKKTLGLIEKGQYSQASVEMLNSKWAKQVGNRSKELSTILKTGKLR
jgi:lysozyme